MGLNAYRAAAKARIDAELKLRAGQWFATLPPTHADALRAILTEGKRLRGSLTCLVAEALGGTLEQALPAALAVEMVQAASLVHDDFVDGDIVRRGRPAAWTLLSSRRAVLVADVMFATAIEKMAQAGAREGATLAHAIAAMAQGALQEGAANTYTEDLDAYRRIIYLKTGSLFAAAARLGALAAGADESMLEAATEFGARSGELYQIADDLADGELGSLNPQSEIALLSAQAGRALAAFPRNDYTRMLADMPEELLRMAVRAPTTPTAAQKRSPTRTR
jgi:geranylgeranyl pyrophosphate synthase